MKNIPVFFKFLGISVLFIYAGSLAFSTYLNVFILDSITDTLTQIIRNKVYINSIDVRFREGVVVKINGLEIHSNYKERKLLTANQVSVMVAYSSLFFGNVEIKNFYRANIFLTSADKLLL